VNQFKQQDTKYIEIG